jgi:hypothetical protein
MWVLSELKSLVHKGYMIIPQNMSSEAKWP